MSLCSKLNQSSMNNSDMLLVMKKTSFCGQVLWTFLTTFAFANSKRLPVYELTCVAYENCDMIK